MSRHSLRIVWLLCGVARRHMISALGYHGSLRRECTFLALFPKKSHDVSLYFNCSGMTSYFARGCSQTLTSPSCTVSATSARSVSVVTSASTNTVSSIRSSKMRMTLARRFSFSANSSVSSGATSVSLSSSCGQRLLRRNGPVQLQQHGSNRMRLLFLPLPLSLRPCLVLSGVPSNPSPAAILTWPAF